MPLETFPALLGRDHTLDAHTALGRTALARASRLLGMPTKTLSNLMFNIESIALGLAEVPGRWKDEALALDASTGGWQDQEQASVTWRSVRDVVRHEIEAEVRRWVAPE